MNCEKCGRKITDEEREKDWPIPDREEGRLVCPSCYGNAAFCVRCGELLGAFVNSPLCPGCDLEDFWI